MAKLAVSFKGRFSAGTLHFKMLANAESCCYQLRFYLNDELIATQSGSLWQPVTITLSAGEHIKLALCKGQL